MNVDGWPPSLIVGLTLMTVIGLGLILWALR